MVAQLLCMQEVMSSILIISTGREGSTSGTLPVGETTKRQEDEEKVGKGLWTATHRGRPLATPEGVEGRGGRQAKSCRGAGSGPSYVGGTTPGGVKDPGALAVYGDGVRTQREHKVSTVAVPGTRKSPPRLATRGAQGLVVRRTFPKERRGKCKIKTKKKPVAFVPSVGRGVWGCHWGFRRPGLETSRGVARIGIRGRFYVMGESPRQGDRM